MKFAAYIVLLLSFSASAQLPLDEQQFIARLKTGAPLPEKLLSTRSAVFYPFNMSVKELEGVQKSFQRTGIDAVIYLENDLLAAGRDVAVFLAEYLNSREIANLVTFQKTQNNYTVYIAEYNKRANLVELNQPSWSFQSSALDVLLQHLYRTAANSLKRENLLINDIPEIDMPITPIGGKRNEFFAADLKVDELAVPKFGNETMDKELEEIMKSFPFKYKLVEAGVSESEMRKQGFLYVLRFVRARAKVAKNLLDYDMARSQSAIVSLLYKDNETQLKNIPANTIVFKFYFKQIESGTVFLGTKWDADDDWQQALINQLKGFKAEFKIP